MLPVGRTAVPAGGERGRRRSGQSMAAVGAAIVQHIQEKGTENISPLILRQMGMAPPKKENKKDAS